MSDHNFSLNFLKPLMSDEERYEVDVSKAWAFPITDQVIRIVHVDAVGKRTPLLEIYQAGGNLHTEELV